MQCTRTFYTIATKPREFNRFKNISSKQNSITKKKHRIHITNTIQLSITGHFMQHCLVPKIEA